MSIPLHNGFQNQTLERVLEDILVRFVINAPPEDLADNARVFFLFEEAHWFYLDYVRTINPYLPLLKMKSFSKKLIELFPLIWNGGDPEEGLKEFGNYKQSIPVRGAALFNEGLTKILLLQGVESTNWSFPRGKISKDEDDVTCAIREVKEETGFDITSYINENDYIERTIRGKNYKIYLVKNIPEDAEFKPTVKNEINQIGWKDFKKVSNQSRNGPNKYFLVSSMIKAISDWIKKNKGEINENQLKKEVEAQLKYLLGIGQQEEKPTIDPGRELLEFIRNSTAKKQLKDHEQSQPLQSSQVPPISNLQHPQQGLQNAPPNFGFQPPPFQQLPFINPFTPPPPFINGVPNFPFPQMFAPYPLPQPQPHHLMHQQFSNQFQPLPQPQQQQGPLPERAPNPEELSRPSQGLRQRNEQESKELLSILNGKSEAKKSNNAKELLDLFHKNKNGTISGGTKKKITLLKREDDDKKEAGGKDYSKNLLALLNRKPEKQVEPKIEAKVEKAEQIQQKVQKPKLKILKRDEPLPSLDIASRPTGNESVTKPEGEKLVPHKDEENRRFESPPPSKELLDLIKKSKQNEEEDVEIFEDYTDEEPFEEEEEQQQQQFGSTDDSIASVRDQNEVDQDIGSDDDNDIDAEYESDADVINEQVPQVSQVPQVPQIQQQKTHSKLSEAVKQAQPVAPTAVPPPKKFKLLRRGEDLDASSSVVEESVAKVTNKSIENSIDEPVEDNFNEADSTEHVSTLKEEKDEIDDTASGTSTIQFSDDDYDDDEEEKEDQTFEESAILGDVEKSRYQDDKTPQTIDTQASNSLLSLLHQSKPGPKQEETQDRGSNPQTLSSNSFNLETPRNIPVVEDSESSNEFVGSLHGDKSSKESEYSSSSYHDAFQDSTQLEQEQPKPEKKDPSISLLDLLKNPKLKDIEPVEQAKSTTSPNGGAELLDILQKNKSPETKHPQVLSSGGADLLSLLHRKKSPEPVSSPESQQIFQHDKSKTGSSANDLLSILHQKEPEVKAKDVNSNEGDKNDNSKSNNSFFEFLMRK